jgi:hypothetical protein
MGLVTSKDKALDALSEFDRQVAIRRQELLEEFDVETQVTGQARPDESRPALTPAAQEAG